MKNSSIVQSLWVGDRLSTMERLCISSFLQNGHTFHLYTYEDVKDVPLGAVLKDANEIVPSDMIFKYKEHNSYAGFSNTFRYKLLFDKGGYWVDCDNVCLKPFTDDAEYIFSSQRPKQSLPNVFQETNSGIIKAPKGSAIMDYCYQEAISKDNNKIRWSETGPQLLASAVKKFDMESYVAVPEKYCAIDWWEWHKFIDGSVDASILLDAQSVHLWNEMWRRNKVDKEGQFERDSLYEQFKNIYLHVIYDENRPVFEWASPSFSVNDINTIRDGAIAVENLNLKLAYELMSIAHKARPGGPYIKKKLEEYKKLITQI